MTKAMMLVMTMTMTMKIAISAILSAKMVGERVNILKYSVESIGNDFHHEKGHDHDHDHENCYVSHF